MKNITLTLVTLMAISITFAINCPWGNEPVCGVDYITYPNQCALAIAYVEKLHMGACEKQLVDGEL